ncbi:MAG: saccharopine dehydrogenase NADP-binding domain-containing protein [Anaerolineales bacterium]|uniref:saccharopine dehydrogenase family protein n=1 Tax=Candidatus Villigracilis vicinus TaxID=3140679 RepID=UPI0031353E21|nr:saccharopine dehydrogenase NADP-binding domain-containing protein [Anaerolineales bacterium]MBK9782590.1 saccharopine dehydrogenase NADP-binding domain-containing protein [Anaerolineales bacterium]
MKVLLVGVGGVGEAIAAIAKPRKWMELMVLADYNVKRAEEVQKKMGDTRRFPVEFIDASNQQSIEDLAKKYQVDLIMNSVDPIFNKQIFDAAYNVGAKYMDMAMTLSEPHPTDPFNKPGIKLGDYQFEKAKDWEKKGLLALVGFGVEPGMADVFARYAQDHLFDEIEEVGIRDGANITIDGYEFAPNFSIWTTIEECLNPPVIWEEGKGWFTTPPFSEPEVFDFPEIGPVEVVNVEHEEVLLVPRWVKTKRATFKYGLGDQFIDVLKTLHMLGLDNKNKINVKGVQVAPRDVVAACLPDPAHLGEKMHGKTCAGTWVKGIKDGKPRQVYLYQVADNQQCMQAWGCQAVVAQTAFSAVIAMDLVEHGQWTGAGVLGPEAFEPTVFMEKMADYGFPYGIKEMTA